MKLFLFLLSLPWILFGCGYHPTATAPGVDVKSVYIEPFRNKTSEPFLESLVTDSLIARIARDSRLMVVADKQSSDAVLSGEISSYSRRAIAYDSEDDIREYRSTIKLTASLRRRTDGNVLWRDKIGWSDESLNNADRSLQKDNEALAIEQIAERLADQLYSRIYDNF